MDENSVEMGVRAQEMNALHPMNPMHPLSPLNPARHTRRNNGSDKHYSTEVASDTNVQARVDGFCWAMMIGIFVVAIIFTLIFYGASREKMR